MRPLSEFVAAIKAALQPLTCEVCKRDMGYVECSDGVAPAAYCSNTCITKQALQVRESS